MSNTNIKKVRTSDLELKDRLVSIQRVTKVTKGGRTFTFSAIVVVGNENGVVGYGLGKAQEVPEALRKATERARKNRVQIPLVEGTLPYEVLGRFGAGRVMLKPASEGTGIIAGGPSRAVLELAGYKNIRSKALGSNNKQNVVLATIAGLKEIKTPEEVARLRGKSVDEL